MDQNFDKHKFKETIDRESARMKRVDLTLNSRRERRQQNIRKRRRETGETLPYNNYTEVIYSLKQEIIDTNKEVNVLIRCVTEFRKILALSHSPPVGDVLDAGLMDLFIELCDHSNEKVVLEAVWCITNIVSGDSEYTEFAVEKGVVGKLLSLLSVENTEIRDQVIWAIGNIAGDRIQYRDLLLSLDAISLLIPSFNLYKMSTIRHATWTLSNLCRGKPRPPLALVLPCLTVFQKLLGDPKNTPRDEEILQDACWTLSYISDGDDERIQSILDHQLAAPIVQLLGHASMSVRIPAVRLIGNMLSGNHMQAQQLVDCEVLSYLEPLLYFENKVIKKESCWAVSNITAGTHTQVEHVLNTGIIPVVIDILNGTDTWDIRKEASWIIANCTNGGTPRQLMAISCVPGCISGICEMLKAEDSKLTLVLLESLDNFLRVGDMFVHDSQLKDNKVAMEIELCGGLTSIETHQEHVNDEISSLCSYLIEEYFGGESINVDGHQALNVHVNTENFNF